MKKKERIRKAITAVLDDWISLQELDDVRRAKLTKKLVEKISQIISDMNKIKIQKYPNTDIFMSYSGDKSKSFWKVVNNLKNDADIQEIYSLGVALQNFESYVLRQLQFKIKHDKDIK